MKLNFRVALIQLGANWDGEDNEQLERRIGCEKERK